MSRSFDDLIQYQVEKFNQQVEDAASLHKHLLKRLCAERIRQDFEEPPKPSMEMRTVQPMRPKPPRVVIISMFQQVGKAVQVGRGVGRRILSRYGSLTQRAAGQPEVVEGEYVVLSDESNKRSNESTNKEEKQP